ncbi:hypothetical protein S40288_08961 [Stachybotrys chartarum IBT 40288]|nr:hypothetical protein S40288_08961 [Stachybotrys chartarum IBT 40288]
MASPLTETSESDNDRTPPDRGHLVLSSPRFSFLATTIAKAHIEELSRPICPAMVFHGPSRACGTCRRRRKKCDETRPSCLRCIKAKRACTGYESGADRTFRRHDPHSGPVTRARKCSLPKRAVVPGTNVLIDDVDVLIAVITEEQRSDYAVRSFLYDFCIAPSPFGASRGFLAGLEQILAALPADAVLARACKAVSHVTHGQPLQRPQLVRVAEEDYQQLLGALAGALKSPLSATSPETKLTAMVLGIYEMSRPRSINNGDHLAHAKGLAALLGTGISPLSLLNKRSYIGKAECEIGPYTAKTGTLFFLPSSNTQALCLDNLLIQLDTLWSQFQDPSPGLDLHVLWTKCVALRDGFTTWENGLAKETRPIAVQRLKGCSNDPDIACGSWPGRIDTYPDLYVASVRNTSRAGQIMLLVLMMKLSWLLGHSLDHLESAIIVHTEDIIASIPYHLAENLYEFLETPSDGIADPGKTLGGLLVMQPLYVASKVDCIDESMRTYLRRSLQWIASNMGIGLAARLAEPEDVAKELLLSACMITWAGFIE